MIYAISILYFGAMYAIKGGWLGMIPGVKDLRKRNKFFDRLLDGKVASSIGVFAFMAIALHLQIGKLVPIGLPWYSIYLVTPAAFTAAWLIAVSPSMGEEAGACGRWGYWWGDYKDAIYPPGHEDAGKPVFDRMYGWKKALQRGVWLGVPFALVTDLPIFIFLGLLFPVLHFAGQQIYYWIHGGNSWKYAEPLIGAICIGIGIGDYLN